MLTQRTLKEKQLDELYDWVDGINLSRPKKNISRDFSDATMMAETIHLYFPKLVELHNYPPTNAIKSKLSNWKTLNIKVLSKFGLDLTEQDCKRLASCSPLAIEPLLFAFKEIIEENKHNQKEEQVQIETQKQEKSVIMKMHSASKVEELREIYALIKEKISLVERSIERKDGQIRELEDILKQYTS